MQVVVKTLKNLWLRCQAWIWNIMRVTFSCKGLFCINHLHTWRPTGGQADGTDEEMEEQGYRNRIRQINQEKRNENQKSTVTPIKDFIVHICCILIQFNIKWKLHYSAWHTFPLLRLLTPFITNTFIGPSIGKAWGVVGWGYIADEVAVKQREVIQETNVDCVV